MRGRTAGSWQRVRNCRARQWRTVLRRVPHFQDGVRPVDQKGRLQSAFRRASAAGLPLARHCLLEKVEDCLPDSKEILVSQRNAPLRGAPQQVAHVGAPPTGHHLAAPHRLLYALLQLRHHPLHCTGGGDWVWSFDVEQV